MAIEGTQEHTILPPSGDRRFSLPPPKPKKKSDPPACVPFELRAQSALTSVGATFCSEKQLAEAAEKIITNQVHGATVENKRDCPLSVPLSTTYLVQEKNPTKELTYIEAHDGELRPGVRRVRETERSARLLMKYFANRSGSRVCPSVQRDD
ncbi:ABC transporter [Anopheles sinensis]|uniref:ABC transporter n=1 Tax=Anopheles sinensis TaxID=74873 RepID=A0A084VKY8_ANOSI|nr:ABC transporter [Anopheles sinensis]